MFFRSSFNREMLDHARTMLLQGHSHSVVVTELRIRWNLDTDRADRLVEQVEREIAASQGPVVAPPRQFGADVQPVPGTTRRRSRHRFRFDIAEFWDSYRLGIIFVGALLFFVMLMVISVSRSAGPAVPPN